MGMPARLIASVLAALTVLCLTPTASAVEVGAGGDRYTGTGGLVLPSGSDSGTRREAAECSGCRWALSDPCSADGGPCLAVTRGCAQMAYLLRLRLSTDGGATWSDRGLVCIPPSGPVTVADVRAEVHRRFERLVPPLDPRIQPARGVVTQIPVNFISGHPAGLSPSTHQIFGRSVVLRPSVRWSWEFGDGASAESDQPGSIYPTGTIRHPYRRAGTWVAVVRAYWSGTFETDGLGPFPVAGGISQSALVRVPVGEGRAVLVP
jgi:hypothetical protein